MSSVCISPQVAAKPANNEAPLGLDDTGYTTFNTLAGNYTLFLAPYLVP